MKVNNANQKHLYNQFNIQKRPIETTKCNMPSFGSGAAVVSLMDMIDRGGFVASFLVQDFLGMNVPRTVTGLYRNREITNQYNYQEAAEVALREFLSGPTMFAVPVLMLWGTKRMFGKANAIPVNIIRALGDNFANNVKGKSPKELADIKTIKASFYNDTFKNILKNTYKSDVPEEVINKEAKRFTDDLLEYENLRAQKKTKKFFDKVRGKRVEGTADDKLADIVQRFSEIRKSNSISGSENFLAAKISVGNKIEAKPLNTLVNDMRNFIEDISSSVSKRVKKGSLNSDNLQQFVKSFTDFRTGSRVLTNFAMIAGIIGFCSYIPKLYQLSDTNPGLKGLENKEKTNEPKKQEKQVAFKGAIDALGRAASKKSGFAKFLQEFEFDGFNPSFSGFLATCGLGILLPRLYHAREENEFKEVIFRDIPTITSVACAAKILQQVFARACTKSTGLALKIKPENIGESKLAKVWSYMKPINGHKVLSSEQLYSKYTNIHQYNGGAAGFAKFLDEQGGNVVKAFDVDKNAKSLLKQIYEKSAKVASVQFDKAKNTDVIEALEDVIKNKKADGLLEKLYEIFKKDDNNFLKKAKIMNSSFNFAVLFAMVPILLGYVIPRINEMLTKKRQLQKNETLNTTKGQINIQDKIKEEKAKESEKVAPTSVIKQSQSKAFKAFNEIIES